MKALHGRTLSLVLAGLLVAAPLPSLAADPAPSAATPAPPAAALAPLPAAGAAGVKAAQGVDFGDIPWVFIAGGAIILVAAALGLSHSSTSSTTNTQ